MFAILNAVQTKQEIFKVHIFCVFDVYNSKLNSSNQCHKVIKVLTGVEYLLSHKDIIYNI